MYTKKDLFKVGIAMVVMFLSFQIGVFVGLSKARFMNHFGDNYIKNIPGGHGSVGKIVSIQLPTIVVTSSDNKEKVITVASSTVITKKREESAQLNVGDFVVVIGDPDTEGKVVAKFIRVLPPHEKN